MTKIGLISHLGESLPKTSFSGKIPYHAAIGMGIPHLVTVHHPTSVLHSVQRRHPPGEKMLSVWEGRWKVWRGKHWPTKRMSLEKLIGFSILYLGYDPLPVTVEFVKVNRNALLNM